MGLRDKIRGIRYKELIQFLLLLGVLCVYCYYADCLKAKKARLQARIEVYDSGR